MIYQARQIVYVPMYLGMCSDTAFLSQASRDTSTKAFIGKPTSVVARVNMVQIAKHSNYHKVKLLLKAYWSTDTSFLKCWVMDITSYKQISTHLLYTNTWRLVRILKCGIIAPRNIWLWEPVFKTKILLHNCYCNAKPQTICISIILPLRSSCGHPGTY